MQLILNVKPIVQLDSDLDLDLYPSFDVVVLAELDRPWVIASIGGYLIPDNAHSWLKSLSISLHFIFDAFSINSPN